MIGTARVRFVEEDGANFRVYLFDIKMNSGQSLRNVKTVGTTATKRAVLILENSKAVIKESQKVNLIYPLPQARPKSLTDFDFEVQRVVTGTASGASLTLSALTVTGETWANTSDWIVTRNDTGAVITNATFGAAGSQSMTVTNLPNVALTIYAKVNKGSPAIRPKTLELDATVAAAVDSDGNGVKFVDMNASDIYEVESIKQTDSDGADLSNLFTVDNGQRAGFYGNGRLVLATGATAPSGNVFCRFKNFTHGTGDFFAVNSYTGQVNYEDIPDFEVNQRTSVNLRDVVDFRSTHNTSDTFVASGVNELPQNGDVFQADVEYYLPRADKIVVTTQGEVKNLVGEAGFGSQVPATPENTLALFNLELNAYGLDDEDVVMTPIKAKRFTMADISELEKRVDKLEEVTSLSLLELDTSSQLVLDGDGSPRTKSGFFVDNFTDRSFSDGENPEYRAAIDPSEKLLSVGTEEDDVVLAYDSDLSTNTILKGDSIYLKYSEREGIVQNLVSSAMNVNPFAVITGEGHLKLSPARDNWFETKYAPVNVINQTATETLADLNLGDRAVRTQEVRMNSTARWRWRLGQVHIPVPGFGTIGGTAASEATGSRGRGRNRWNRWGGWRRASAWNWVGVPNNARVTEVGATDRSSGGFDITRSFSQRVVVGQRTVRKQIADRTVSLTFIPFIRSRKVFFKAEGLRPNTRYFPFFDGKKVDQFCRDETFKRYGRKSTDLSYARRYRNSTSHPQGSGILESDNEGKIEGSFFIPSRKGLRFRAGTREFKLLDISKNDDNAALSRATFNYTAQGTLDTRQKTITSTRITTVQTRRWTETTRVRFTDPLAQSFQVTNPSGIYVTKVQCYFKSKDSSGVPIQLQIRPMVNGAPSATDIHSQSIVFLPPSQVNTPSAQTQSAVVAAPTTFEFDEPIFLNPQTEYAIVLLAESTEYEAYVGETYAFELGSTEKRISRQPSMGSLFKSQNGTTWEPDQTKDMAFKIFTADFVSSGSAVFENRDVDLDLVEDNGLFMTSGSSTVTALGGHHGFHVGDTVNISGLVDATTYNGVLGSNINGARTITAVDGFAFQFAAGSNATSSGRFGGDDVLFDKQIIFDTCIPQFSTLMPDDTSLTYNAKFTTGKSLAASSGSQVKYQKDGSFSSDLGIADVNRFTAPRMIANPSNETAELGSGQRSCTFKIDMSTVRSDVSPVIDAQNASLTTEANLIDNQAAATTNGFNVPIDYVAETDAFGGSSLAKHVTSVGELEEPAVGLKVMLAAMRPAGSSFDLYWRVSNGDQNIFDVDWTLETVEDAVAPDENNFREYRYLIGGDDGTVDPFTSYQFKIVMNGNNSSKPPVFRDFRSIALAV